MEQGPNSRVWRRVSPLPIFAIIFIAGLVVLDAGQSLYTPIATPYAVLYGEHLIPSLGALLMAGAVIGTGIYGLARQGMGRFSLAMYALAGLISLHYLHISSNLAYTNDVPGHFGYADFISQHWLSPSEYHGGVHWQPPFYYYAAAAVIRLTEGLGAIHALTGLRFFSWLSYLVFNAFSLLCLRQAGFTGIIYKTSAALLLLWPGGIHMASKISNEPFFYAWYAAGLYYTVTWYQSGEQRRLMWALLLTGIAFMVRLNTIALLGTIAILAGMACYRGRFTLRSLWSVQWAVTAGVFILCLQIAASRIMVGSAFQPRQTDGTVASAIAFPANHFFSVHYDFMHPYNDWSESQSFWDFLLKTSIFGEYPDWPHAMPWLMLSGLMYSFLFMIAMYAVIPWLIARRTEFSGRLLPFCVGLIFPLMALLAYAACRRYPYSQDARYIYPALCCFAVWFGGGIELLRSRQMVFLYATGLLCAWSFILISVIYFWNVAR